MALSNNDGILTPQEILAEMREAYQRRHTRATNTPTLTKLAEQLADASNSSHTHPISEVTGLTEELAGTVRTVNGAAPDADGNATVAVEPPDTGWRNMQFLIDSTKGWNYNEFKIRRRGDFVTIAMNGVYNSWITDTSVPTGFLANLMPVGWRAAAGGGTLGYNIGVEVTWMAYGNLFGRGFPTTSETRTSALVTYACFEPWPTTLIGNPM